MFVADWMTRGVVTVGPGESIGTAVHRMQEKGIKHLPVVAEGRVRGMISDRDVRSYSPSTATTLDIYELHYLLAKAKVADAMVADVTTVAPDTPVEEAALLLLERNIGALPVTEGGALVGIISDRDIFRALVDISGVRHGGHRICLTVEDRPGSIRDAADLVRRHGFLLQGLLTSYAGVPKGQRRVVLRAAGEGDFAALVADLEAGYADLHVTRG
jgi:acetoin utilization protein AcuB